jgi:hypothetical protein
MNAQEGNRSLPAEKSRPVLFERSSLPGSSFGIAVPVTTSDRQVVAYGSESISKRIAVRAAAPVLSPRSSTKSTSSGSSAKSRNSASISEPISVSYGCNGRLVAARPLRRDRRCRGRGALPGKPLDRVFAVNEVLIVIVLEQVNDRSAPLPHGIDCDGKRCEVIGQALAGPSSS